MSWTKHFFELAYQLDHGIDAAVRGLEKSVGIQRPLTFVPYRGIGTQERVWLRGRVLEERGQNEPSLERGWVGGLRASYQRFRTVERAGIPVRFEWNGRSFPATSDDEGFVSVQVSPPDGVAPGLHSISCVVGEAADPVSSQVEVVDPTSRVAVITDIDDTVIITDVTNRLSRAKSLLLSEVHGRQPFEGVRELYSALSKHGPTVYLSSSPYNLHDHLTHFLDLHGLPFGPVLLRDWGLSRTGFAPDGKHGHKIEKAAQMMELLPDLRFLLIGDSSQSDAGNYVELCRRFPGRVVGILIRRVPTTDAKLARLPGLSEESQAMGVPFALFDESHEALQLAEQWLAARKSEKRPVK